MLTQEATPEMVKKWNQIYQQKRGLLSPNRKTGTEINDYLRSKYPVTPINTEEADQVVVKML